MSALARPPYLVVCEIPFEPHLRDLVTKAHPSARVEFRPPPAAHGHAGPTEGARLAIDPASVLISHWPPSDWSQARNLEWMQTDSAGIDYLANNDIWTRPVTLTNAAGAYAIQIAQYVMANLLAVFDRHALRHEAQARRHWPEWGDERDSMIGRPLRGATMVIVGYGGIGREVGRLAKAFGMRVIAVKAHPESRTERSFVIPGTGDPDGILPDEIVGTRDLVGVAPRADVLVITVPLTDQTRGLVDAAVLGALPRSAWIVNAARGSVVDELALLHVLDQGLIGGAILDVFDAEPLPSDSRLWGLPNVVISPHVAGGGAASRELFAPLVVENLRRFSEGQPLLNVVRGSAGY